MSKILDALAKLDPSNDNHWTGEGFPRVETVAMFSGEQGVKREDITKVAPGFTRQTANALPAVQGEQAASTQGNTEQAATGEPSPESAETAGVSDQEAEFENVANAIEVQDFDSAIETERIKLDEARVELETAQAKYEAQQRKLDQAIDAKEAAGIKETNSDAIGGYLEQQRRQREELARRQEEFGAAGATAVQLLKLLPQKSPLDRALASRKGNS